MESQSSKNSSTLLLQNNQAQLITRIISTYSARSQADIKDAQLSILQSFSRAGFIDKLIQLLHKRPQQLNSNVNESHFKKAIAILIKKFSYTFAESEEDKSKFIEMLYNLIISDSLNFYIKEILGQALEHQFNKDQQFVYKNVVKERALQILNSPNNFAKIDSITFLLSAYLNSLTYQDDQINFFIEIVQPFSLLGIQIQRLISKTPFEQFKVKGKLIKVQLEKYFDLIETALERITEFQDEYPQELKELRQNHFLMNLLESYLLLFNNNHSIVSQIYAQINPLKHTIMNIIKLLYQFNTCPLKIFQIIFLTFLIQSKNIVNNIQKEQILVNCLFIIQSHLQRKIYMNLFTQHKMEIIFGLFMYSVTNQEEFEYMEGQPYKFVQMAEEYSQGAVNSGYLKIRASSLLKVFAERLDEAIHTIIEILMVIMSGSLQISGHDSQIMLVLKNEFSKFNFNGLNSQQKLETSFIILTALSPHINRRKDMQKIIYAFLLTQFELLVKIESPIVILRVIRALSYYPSALYFMYIETQMNRGQIYIIEGLKAFQRILKTNKHQELFHFLSSILTKLLNLIKIEDPIMQLIVINLYDKILRPNLQFYKACLLKIKDSFALNMNSNQHASIICFNLLYSLLSKQKTEQIVRQIQNIFYQISDFLQNQPDAQLFNKYQSNLVDIYDTIVLKNVIVPLEVQNFAKRTIRDLVSYQKGSSYFKFYNSYLIRLEGAIFKLQPYFVAFWEQFKRRCQLYVSQQDQQILSPIPYYSFLMSQIIASHNSIPITQQHMQQLIQISNILPQQYKQYPLIIFLTELYVQPVYATEFLKKHSLYTLFLDGIIKIDFNGKILKKIYNLAFIQLLEVEDNPLLLKQIIIQCINNLKQVYQKPKLKQAKKGIEIKPRIHVDDKDDDREQHIQNQQNDNGLVNLFAKFKHPFQNYSQFDQFKVKCWQNDSVVNGLEPSVKQDLRIVIETQIIDNTKARVIRKIKK